MAKTHLNGSVNLDSSEEVFRAVAGTIGDQIDKIPDGETAQRHMWIAALIPKFQAMPELDAQQVMRGERPGIEFSLKPGIDPGDVEFPDLGYAQYARNSYALFAQLRSDGLIAAGTRFQVSLPTVIAGVNPFIAPSDVDALRPAYERRLRSEVEQILAEVPHEDLAMQWDVAVEMGIVENAFGYGTTETFDSVTDELAELAGWIPEDVPVGYHLCYGDQPTPDSGGVGKHWKEPEDASVLVNVANTITDKATRVVNWFSMPVPINRDDDAYFEPLKDLKLANGATLYLGLVHHEDGVEGTQRRIDAAKRHYRDFGVATECGMARKPREAIQTLLEIHAAVTV